MSKEVSALELRKHFGEVMDEVRYRKEPYIVKRNGRPVVVLIDFEVFQALESRKAEEAFIETYTDERIAEFLKTDTIDQRTRQQVKHLLGE